MDRVGIGCETCVPSPGLRESVRPGESVLSRGEAGSPGAESERTCFVAQGRACAQMHRLNRSGVGPENMHFLQIPRGCGCCWSRTPL